jgi:hypothetical protein
VFRTRTHVGIFVDDAPGPIVRAQAIVPHLRSQVTLLSNADPRDLPQDDRFLRLLLPKPAATSLDGGAPAPIPPALGPAGGAELVAWLEQESPDLLFVDGPADVAIFARLAGAPVVGLRRHGRRPMAQQQLIDRSARGMLAPYPQDLAAPDEPVSTRTVHTGLLSRFAGRPADRARARRQLGLGAEDRLVTVLGGARGVGASDQEFAAAAASTPGWRWHVLGAGGPPAAPEPGVHRLGWVADPWPHLTAADVVITGGSPAPSPTWRRRAPRSW